ncbi:alpha/beta fold hydrolase [Rubellimicrobium aerolatum]|uniref:Alpha/beta fold hydrolase n=1 Tax=Rubellimicrobium aerolatum TaxID=490979 RepID=A0ABW0SE70_9RHOB|nr:hypothetical protein [Rubellimicrobium aerolatum]MBP1806843.1 pimeloyl-ACP methyl ester carboxylesterase [Rubellimicrobium aerolatum]
MVRIAAPVLVPTGAQDPNSTPEMERAMAVAAPRTRLCVIEGHRHMVNPTEPGTVTEATEGWLAMPATAAEEARVR